MALVEWTVSGTLETQRDFPASAATADPNTRSRPLPLADVDVRLLRQFFHDDKESWSQVARARTNRDGNFTLTGQAPEDAARFRIVAQFRNDDVCVRPSTIAQVSVSMTGPGGTGLTINENPPDDGVTQMTVFQDVNTNTTRTRSVGTLRFENASTTPDLQHDDHIVRAVFWHAAELLARRLRKANLSFGGRVHVIWPGHVLSTSYSTHVVPYLTQRQVHIDQDLVDGEKLVTLFHEMMHIWNYDHNHGVTKWYKGVASRRHGWDGDTNGDLFTPAQQEWPNIAFHEGFAEFAALEFLHELFGQPKPLPFRRAHIASAMGLTPPITSPVSGIDLSVVATMSALRCLTTPDLHHFVFGGASDSDSGSGEVSAFTGSMRPATRTWPSMTIFQVLKIFLPGPEGSNFDKAWEVGDKDIGIRQFLARAAALSPTTVTQAARQLILKLIDPASTVEPSSLTE